MPIHCVGLNHKSADISLREKLAFSENIINKFVDQYLQPDVMNQWEEIVVLSTCNRTEIYAVTSSLIYPKIKELMAEFFNICLLDFAPYLYEYEDEKVVKHLFKVASSLDSMLIGEPQILGQVTEAYQFGLKNGGAGKTLSKLFQAAIHTGKRGWSESAIGEKSVSVSSMAAKLISQKTADIKNSTIVLLGAGEMAELAIESLRKRGAKKIHVINRTFAHATVLAEKFKCEANPYSELPKILKEAEVLLTSTSAPHTIIEVPMIQNIMGKRKNPNPITIFDIALPRDVSPEVGDIPNVNLFDIDTLQTKVDDSLKARQQEIPKVEDIISDEVDIFVTYLATEKIVPVIVKMRDKAHRIRLEELEKALRQMPDLNQKTQDNLELLTKSIVNKILSQPIKKLRQKSVGPEYSTYAEVTQSLFDLEEIYE
jgi:glutamyl-tRNA reductase